MAFEDDASKGTEGCTEWAASNVVEIDKRPLIRKGDLKKGTEESAEHSRSNVVEIGKRSFIHPMLNTDTL